jgi:hypothetical protein
VPKASNCGMAVYYLSPEMSNEEWAEEGLFKFAFRLEKQTLLCAGKPDLHPMGLAQVAERHQVVEMDV